MSQGPEDFEGSDPMDGEDGGTRHPNGKDALSQLVYTIRSKEIDKVARDVLVARANMLGQQSSARAEYIRLLAAASASLGKGRSSAQLKEDILTLCLDMVKQDQESESKFRDQFNQYMKLLLEKEASTQMG